MLPHHLRQTVGELPGIVGLPGCQRRHSNGETVEINRRHSLREPSRAGGDDAQSAGASHESERGEAGKAARRLRRSGHGPKEAHAQLIHHRWTKCLNVTQSAKMNTGRRDGRESGNTRGRQWVIHARPIVVVIKRPVTSLLVVEVHALANLVVVDAALLAGVREPARLIWSGNVRQNPNRRRRPR